MIKRWLILWLSGFIFISPLVITDELQYYYENVLGQFWFWACFLIPLFHQSFVLYFWTKYLYGYPNQLALNKNRVFQIYKIIFAGFLILRIISIFFFALGDAYSLYIEGIYKWSIIGLLLVPFIVTIYSTFRHFSFDRAVGRDHFYSHEYSKEKELNKGIFRYISNPMYIFGFFIYWIMAFLFESEQAFYVAFYSHALIWVHYYTVEKPDIQKIYSHSFKISK